MVKVLGAVLGQKIELKFWWMWSDFPLESISSLHVPLVCAACWEEVAEACSL